MTLVKQYCISRYGEIPDDTLDDDQIIINAMNKENGIKLPFWENKRFEVTVSRVPLRLIHTHQHYSPDAREPVGDPLVIHGVLVKEGGTLMYRMVDGYHRLRWLKDHAAVEGTFIVLNQQVS